MATCNTAAKEVASTKANIHMSSGVAAKHTSLVFVDMMEDNVNLKETHYISMYPTQIPATFSNFPFV